MNYEVGWILKGFDPESLLLVDRFVLSGIDGPTLKTLLELDDSEYPIEQALHHINIEDVLKLSPYLDNPEALNLNLTYDVGLWRI